MLVDALGSIPPGLLYPHQADGVAFLISKGRVILGDRARKVSGQTPIVAWAAGVQAVSAAANAISARRLEQVGLKEIKLPALHRQRGTAGSSSVPRRRWYGDQRGSTPASEEVVLIYRKV